VRVDDNEKPIYVCLNGEWEFQIDRADSGLERELNTTVAPYDQKIQVPFCPESDLSGVGDKDFMHVVWYRRSLTVPEEWKGRETVVHFQAVDYDATVWAISEKTGSVPVEVVRHRGGFTPFSGSLRDIADGGESVTSSFAPATPRVRRHNLGASNRRRMRRPVATTRAPLDLADRVAGVDPCSGGAQAGANHPECRGGQFPDRATDHQQCQGVPPPRVGQRRRGRD
jgi:hypothetical protein